jgi:2-polyprenyl-3-methyl-5-hydroxy-6-metoxy-1,4-benzoquinol methylase
MSNYREKIYSKYVSSHVSQLHGETDLAKIEKQFPVWDQYYGRHLPSDKNINILEIGCGEGGLLYYLRNRGYKNCLGVEIGKEQISLAQRLGIDGVKQADIKEFLRDKIGEYDVIFARDVLEHLNKEEVFEVIENVFKALKPGGRFIVQTPNAEGPFGTRYYYQDFTHEIVFSASSLSQVLRVVGFGKIEFFRAGPVVHGLKSAIRYFLWRIIELKLRLYLLIETGGLGHVLTQNLIAVAEK